MGVLKLRVDKNKIFSLIFLSYLLIPVFSDEYFVLQLYYNYK